jgi:hypothetical protein
MYLYLYLYLYLYVYVYVYLYVKKGKESLGIQLKIDCIQNKCDKIRKNGLWRDS